MNEESEWARAYENEALIRYSMSPDGRMILDGIWPGDEEQETAGSAGTGSIQQEDSMRRTSPSVPCLFSEPASGSITGVSRSVKKVPL